MRIFERVLAVTVASLGVGIATANAFDGTRSPDAVSPAVAVDVVPRSALPVAPPDILPTNNPVTSLGVPPSSNLGLPPNELGRNALSATEAFRTGAHALRAGDIRGGLLALEYAARNGHPIAQWKLGRMYADGDQVPQDAPRAFKYFRDVADGFADDNPGTPQARFVANSLVALGIYYLDGIPGTLKADPNRARQMFFYAASYFGDGDAQYHLGRMLLDGVGGHKDVRQAVRWLKLSADKGQYEAQALLGNTLFKGQGMPRQAARGLMYLTMARDSAPKENWVVELHAAASQAASEDERALALSYLEGWLKGRRD